MLFIRECNHLHDILPELFEATNDYSELLLSLSYTDKDGVVFHLVNDISEDDFNIEKEGQVEIIGWMYQYYNTEPKDKVFGSSQKERQNHKGKYTGCDPAVYAALDSPLHGRELPRQTVDRGTP